MRLDSLENLRPMPTTVLVVEDEEDVRTLICKKIADAGMLPLQAATGSEGLSLARHHSPNLVLLDWMLPGQSGIDVCKTLKRDSATAHLPVILLTAKSEEADRVTGLEAGADDYLVKPFSVRELILRIQSELRKSQRTAPLDGPDLRVGTLELFRNQHLLRSGSRSITLDPPEVLILALLMSNPGQLLKADILAEKLRSAQEPGSRITTDIRHRMEALREKVALLEDRLVCDPRAGYGISC